MKLRAIFFDLFETLISEYENGKSKIPSSTFVEEKLNIDAKLFSQEWNSRQEKRMNGAYPDFPSVVREILTTLGHNVHDDIILALNKERTIAKTIPFDKIDDRILSMLQEIKKHEIKTCLISNCTEEEVTVWNSSELSKYFDFSVFSYQVKVSKPNPLIYQLACERLGVSPTESIFVGDGSTKELDGAKQVGMKAYHATWFIPNFMSERITDYPKLEEPSKLLDIIRSL